MDGLEYFMTFEDQILGFDITQKRKAVVVSAIHDMLLVEKGLRLGIEVISIHGKDIRGMNYLDVLTLLDMTRPVKVGFCTDFSRNWSDAEDMLDPDTWSETSDLCDHWQISNSMYKDFDCDGKVRFARGVIDPTPKRLSILDKNTIYVGSNGRWYVGCNKQSWWSFNPINPMSSEFVNFQFHVHRSPNVENVPHSKFPFLGAEF